MSLRKFLASQAPSSPSKASSPSKDDPTKNAEIAIGSFDLIVSEADFQKLPHTAALMRKAVELSSKYLTDKASEHYLPYVPDEQKEKVQSSINDLESDALPITQARRMFTSLAQSALGYLEAHWLEKFLGSDHYGYILELKAKEGFVPKIDQFQVIRVLGEGGFGQVIEVVKRDCGVRYAMKVMQKESMKQALGVTWRKKIAMEANILSSLLHPFMVNLYYAFQNSDFLCLVMDLVPSVTSPSLSSLRSV